MEVKNQEYGYELALKLAREQLAKLNVKEQCRRSGARYIPSQNSVLLEYLNQPHSISIPDGEVTLADKKEAAPIRDKILILHYFILAKGTALTNNLISFKELPEGTNYYPTFHQRAIKPLIKRFGNEPEKLLSVAQMLGGCAASYGDVSVTIDAFPKVPITLVLWRGDEEFLPEGNILFDSTISHYLPVEDIIVVCEIITWRLVKAERA